MGAFDELLREMILVCALIALPVLACAALVGIVIAILQAATQIQEQTLTQLPKILAVATVVVLFGRFGISLCAGLFNDALTSVPELIRAAPGP